MVRAVCGLTSRRVHHVAMTPLPPGRDDFPRSDLGTATPAEPSDFPAHEQQELHVSHEIAPEQAFSARAGTGRTTPARAPGPSGGATVKTEVHLKVAPRRSRSSGAATVVAGEIDQRQGEFLLFREADADEDELGVDLLDGLPARTHDVGELLVVVLVEHGGTTTPSPGSSALSRSAVASVAATTIARRPSATIAFQKRREEGATGKAAGERAPGQATRPHDRLPVGQHPTRTLKVGVVAAPARARPAGRCSRRSESARSGRARRRVEEQGDDRRPTASSRARQREAEQLHGRQRFSGCATDVAAIAVTRHHRARVVEHRWDFAHAPPPGETSTSPGARYVPDSDPGFIALPPVHGMRARDAAVSEPVVHGVDRRRAAAHSF